MLKNSYKSKLIIASLLLTGLFSACKKDEPTPTAAPLRTSISYSVLTDTTAYGRLFVDANGDSTVNRTEGKNLYTMFRALNAYSSSSVSANMAIDAITLKNYYANTGTFTGTTAADLNAMGTSLRALTASSRGTDAEVVRAKMESNIDALATASTSVTGTASKGVAGKLGSYLVDAKGVEWVQIIQKSLIGGFQVDYVGNVLLSDDKLSNANNKVVVAGQKYSELEHNWDIAYGVITIKDRYASAATATSAGGESFIGSYMWEYNKDGYPKIHPALLKGRVAIVNNDITEVKAQAKIIRTEMEKAIAAAAVGYLGKWKTAVAAGVNSADAVRAHAMGEGLGFIYSLRFCTVHGGTDAFSDELLNDLVNSSPNGFWDLTNDKVTAAADKITSKFGL